MEAANVTLPGLMKEADSQSQEWVDYTEQVRIRLVSEWLCMPVGCYREDGT